MPAHRLWMKSGASGRAINQDGSVTIAEDAIPDYRETTDTLSGYPFKEAIEGALVFPKNGGLPRGTYYLKELSVPEGYELNSRITKVVIDNSGVYADAGEKDDGIKVNRSIGMIVKSMVQFAAGDDVDNTLHDLITKLQISNNYNGDETKWKDTDPVQKTYLRFQPDSSQTILEYEAIDGDAMRGIDEGWSRLEVKQNYEDPDHQVSSDLKMDWRQHTLNNLFSGLVFVTVTNDRVGNLEISKRVESDLGVDTAQEFELQIMLEDITDPNKPVELKESYQAQITDVNGNLAGEAFEIKSGDKVQLKHDQRLTVYKLPYGTRYTVTEAKTPGYIPSVTINGVLTEGTSSDEGYAVSGEIVWTGSDGTATVEKVAYTNTYSNSVTLTGDTALKGQKTLLGGALPGHMFEFTLAPDPEDQATQEAIAGGWIQLPDEIGKNVSVDGGTLTDSKPKTFIFGDVTFKAPGNYRFIIAETVPDGVGPDGKLNLNDGRKLIYDMHRSIVTVKVEQDQTNGGILKASVMYDNAGAPSELDQELTDTAAFTNDQTGRFHFTKTDKTGQPVAGAKFAMYRLECQNSKQHDHIKELLKVDKEGNLTDEEQKKCWKLTARSESKDGTHNVVFEELPVAEEYRLVEYEAAPGYVTPSGQWRVIYMDGKFLFPSSEGSGGIDSAVGNPPAVETGENGYAIVNYKPTELPFSGNKGIKMFLILGTILMTAGGVGSLWIARIRRRKV